MENMPYCETLFHLIDCSVKYIPDSRNNITPLKYVEQ